MFSGDSKGHFDHYNETVELPSYQDSSYRGREIGRSRFIFQIRGLFSSYSSADVGGASNQPETGGRHAHCTSALGSRFVPSYVVPARLNVSEKEEDPIPARFRGPVGKAVDRKKILSTTR